MAELEYKERIRQYVKADEVRAVILNDAAIICARLDAIPDTLSAQLAAEKDEQRCRAILADNIEITKTELHRRFLKLAEQPPEPT